MWTSFAFLFTIATFGLELLEGNKITTTAYYGLRNLGLTFIIFISLFSVILYLISFLPVTIIVNKFINALMVRVIIYSIQGGIIGIWAFNKLYGFADGYLIKEYDLDKNSAIFIFGIAGLLYALVDYYFKKKATIS